MLIKTKPDAPNPYQGKEADEAARAITLPAQRADESAAEYSDRLAWHHAREKKDKPDLFERPIQGWVATSGGMIPWYESAYIGEAGTSGATDTPQLADTLNVAENTRLNTVDTVTFPDLPPIVQRTPQERFDDISMMLFALATQSYIDGVMRLPRSIQEKLVRLGVYKSVEDAALATPENVFQAWADYGKHLLAG